MVEPRGGTVRTHVQDAAAAALHLVGEGVGGGLRMAAHPRQQVVRVMVQLLFHHQLAVLLQLLLLLLLLLLLVGGVVMVGRVMEMVVAAPVHPLPVLDVPAHCDGGGKADGAAESPGVGRHVGRGGRAAVQLVRLMLLAAAGWWA